MPVWFPDDEFLPPTSTTAPPPAPEVGDDLSSATSRASTSSMKDREFNSHCISKALV